MNAEIKATTFPNVENIYILLLCSEMKEKY
jgi:hypothetical protein